MKICDTYCAHVDSSVLEHSPFHFMKWKKRKNITFENVFDGWDLKYSMLEFSLEKCIGNCQPYYSGLNGIDIGKFESHR